MIGAYDVRKAVYILDGDPGADNKQLHWFRAPADITITSAYMVAANTMNDGTAITIAIQDWGTAGTAVEGTIAAALGGTATASVLTAKIPSAFTVSAAHNYVSSGCWVVLDYQEEGSGFISTDRFVIDLNYVMGKGSTTE